jgi:hypothetical protein
MFNVGCCIVETPTPELLPPAPLAPDPPNKLLAEPARDPEDAPLVDDWPPEVPPVEDRPAEFTELALELDVDESAPLDPKSDWAWHAEVPARQTSIVTEAVRNMNSPAG